MSNAGWRFKSVVVALVREGIYPSPTAIRLRLGRLQGCRSINGSETRWRRQILTELGWTERKYPHKRRFSWIPPVGWKGRAYEGHS